MHVRIRNPYDRRREKHPSRTPKKKKGKNEKNAKMEKKELQPKYDRAHRLDALNIDTMKCFEEHKILSLYAWIIFFSFKKKRKLC